jgi:hypothetical protein
MSLDTMFTLEVVLVMVLVAAAAGGALYLAVSNRRARRETGREVSTADIPVGTAPEEYAEDTIESATPREPRREFYKSMGLETTEDMKIRLYSLEEYQDELGGTRARPDSGFVAATKAYRQLDDEWHDYSPRKAADVLELAQEDYEVDRERSALLIKEAPARIAAGGQRRPMKHSRRKSYCSPGDLPPSLISIPNPAYGRFAALPCSVSSRPFPKVLLGSER